jgi:hypothetical protein
MFFSRRLFETFESRQGVILHGVPCPMGSAAGFIHYDERRVGYGKTDSVGGLFNNDEGKGEEGKEAYLDGLL